MSFNKSLSIASALAVLAGASFVASAANAGGAKEVFVETYTFNKPMHGYSGRSGNYYCDYQRLPQRKCVTNANGTESCKVVAWTLREMCQ